MLTKENDDIIIKMSIPNILSRKNVYGITNETENVWSNIYPFGMGICSLNICFRLCWY